jgi:N-acetylneuraminic acid mutarotase
MIYVFGGQRMGGGAGIKTVEAYDPASDSWRPRTSMPTALLGMTANAVNDKCYVIGGSDAPGGAAVNRVDEYDPVTDKWRRRAGILTARVAGASTVLDGKIYVAGGLATSDTRSTAVASLEIYDPASNTWTSGVDMPTARAVLAASVANKEVFFIGGGSEALGALDTSTVESYDPATNTWTRWADMPSPRGTLTAATVNGLIYAIGGGFNIGQVATVEVYDPLSNIWSERTDMPTARWGVASGVIGRKIYVLGGSTELGVGHNSLSANEVYTAESPGINSSHAGAWFNPDTSGQGQFIDVVPAEQFMFISWFTFTDAASDNPNEQNWYTAQGNYSGNKAVLDLFETLGGKFDDPQEVTTTQVGEVTLSFSDCEQGQMTYSFDEEELQGEFPLIKVIGGSGNACEEFSGNSTEAVDINAGMDGAWFDPDTSGQGYFIDAHPDPEGGNFIFVSWFTYGDATASGQRWLTAQGGFEGSTAEIDVFETTGGSFDDPEPVSTTKVGTMSLDFTDCSNAQLTYSLPADPAEGDIAIIRVISGSQALCEELVGAD